MLQQFQNIIDELLCKKEAELFSATMVFNSDSPQPIKLNAAFLICLAGEKHPDFAEAKRALQNENKYPGLAAFFMQLLEDVKEEVSSVGAKDVEFSEALSDLHQFLKNTGHPFTQNENVTINKLWQAFFPEGVDVFAKREEKATALRQKRVVEVKAANPNPIADPAKEMIITSNVLLGIPAKDTDIDSLKYSDALKSALKEAVMESQLYWYDHPIQIGVKPEGNEIIYGLFQLDKVLDVEKERGNLQPDDKMTCVLSVSVTHKGLQTIAGDYIHQEIDNYGELKNLEVFTFTEIATDQLVNEVLLPAVEKLLPTPDAQKLLEVFGVDGEYGRHYSFLKAIVALWNALINKDIRTTFKIDLDQVFPQKELIEQSGKSAFEHFKTPLWGAKGTAVDGKNLELGMIAGALVNERDISKGLFTPDVKFPGEEIPDKESHLFYSKLLMALSTEGELMTRYKAGSEIDGKNKCIQRIHVTGGTNGIMVDALRKYRPFAPSFIGRAEDQSYILSVLCKAGQERLAYLHEDGLIMRHDKEAFASEALKAAKFGNIVGDYIRLLYFSEYARALTNDVEALKEIVNPFTGCFISKIPITMCMFRYVLKGADFYEQGDEEKGARFFTENAPRLRKAIDFIKGENSLLKQQVEQEQKGWNLFYDLLDKLEESGDQSSDLQRIAQDVIEGCRV